MKSNTKWLMASYVAHFAIMDQWFQGLMCLKRWRLESMNEIRHSINTHSPISIVQLVHVICMCNLG